MPIIYSLLIFFLCFSINVCNAGRSGFLKKNSNPRLFQYFSKEREKIEEGGLHGGAIITHLDDIQDQHRYHHHHHRQEPEKKDLKRRYLRNSSSSSSLAVENHGDDGNGRSPAGLFSDYSQPRTRTPSHN